METNTNNNIKRRALGRGLEELFNNEPLDYNKIEEKIITETPKEEIIKVPIEELRSNPYQPRKIFDEKALEELADKLAKTVLKNGKSVTLEPMAAYERKIIHNRLQNNKTIKTYSVGEEPYRKVVIAKNK